MICFRQRASIVFLRALIARLINKKIYLLAYSHLTMILKLKPIMVRYLKLINYQSIKYYRQNQQSILEIGMSWAWLNKSRKEQSNWILSRSNSSAKYPENHRSSSPWRYKSWLRLSKIDSTTWAHWCQPLLPLKVLENHSMNGDLNLRFNRQKLNPKMFSILAKMEVKWAYSTQRVAILSLKNNLIILRLLLICYRTSF